VAQWLRGVVIGAQRLGLAYKNYIAEVWDSGGVGNLEDCAAGAGLAAVVVQNGRLQYVLAWRRKKVPLKRNRFEFRAVAVFLNLRAEYPR